MWVQWCIAPGFIAPGCAAFGWAAFGPDWTDSDADDDRDCECDDVVAVEACVVPPVAASATPVAPAPIPAARAAVMASRRVLPTAVDAMCTLRFLDMLPRAGLARSLSMRVQVWLTAPERLSGDSEIRARPALSEAR
jgi:hypothetical protein